MSNEIIDKMKLAARFKRTTHNNITPLVTYQAERLRHFCFLL